MTNKQSMRFDLSAMRGFGIAGSGSSKVLRRSVAAISRPCGHRPEVGGYSGLRGQMSAADFASLCRQERDSMLAAYAMPNGQTEVARHLEAAALNGVQREHVAKALETALTDAFYTILLALDGAASLGGKQQVYRVLAENGRTISSGDGTLEAAAYAALQSQ
jgi:hypothetical protein